MLARLRVWSPKQLQNRPAEGAWSALEVVDHLMRTERSIGDAARTYLPEKRSVSVEERARFLAISAMFRMPTRVRVPAAVSQILPSDTPSLDVLTEQWEQEGRRWHELLGSPLAADASFAAMRHPASGWISLRGALHFVAVHTRHHEFQLDRIAQASRDVR